MIEKMRNMKLRSRMLLSYAVIIVICLIASIVALFMLNKIGDNLTSFYNNNYTVTVNVWQAKREMQAARADILNAILDSDANKIEESIEEAKGSLKKMRGTFPANHSKGISVWWMRLIHFCSRRSYTGIRCLNG